MNESTPAKQEEWKSSVNPWCMIIPVMLATFMYALDETVANVALPHIAGSFSVSSQESIWVLTSYLMASSIVIPMIDFFCKLLGRRNYFILSVLIFTIASFLCGTATSIGMIVFARALQGFGGGCLIPLSQAISMEAFTGEDRNKSMAVFGLVVIVAPILGPVLGGWITENWSWPYIFFINIPFGVISILLAKKFLEDPPYARRQKSVSFDKSAFFWLCIWLIPLQIVFDKGNEADWFNATWICQLSVISILGAVMFIWTQIKGKDPLLKLDVFKDKNYLVGTGMLIMVNAVLLASMAILPQMLQYMLGYDSFLSGLAIMPRGLGAFCALLFFGGIGGRLSYRTYATIGLTCLGIGGWQLSLINLQISPVSIMIPNFIFGVGLILSMMPIVTMSCITLKNSQMTNASSLQNLLKTIGGALGTSLVATMLSRFSQIHQFGLVKNLNPENINYITHFNANLGAMLPIAGDNITAKLLANKLLYMQLLQQSTLCAYMDSFKIFAIGCFILLPFLFLIKSNVVNKLEN